MTINNQEIIVKWENNTSVAALKEIVKTQPLVIETSRYGGFEQVGSLGQSIKSSDQRQTTEIGDIMFRYVQNYDDVGMKILCSQFKSLHKELQFRLLSAMIKIVGEQAYAPESEEISRVCQTLNSENYQGRTLGGCEIFVAQQSIWVVKEAKNPTVLSKSAWDEFVLYHRQYRRLELPYKLRVAIVEKCMNQNRS